MTKLFATPQRSIALGIALSALLHGLLLWLPAVQLPLHEPKLAPLIAKLEALPQPSRVAHARPEVLPKPQPKPVIQSAPEMSVAASPPVDAPAMAEPELAQEEAEVVPPQTQRPQLPRHARLQFSVYQGAQNFKIGESTHTLDVADGFYTLKASIQTTGLASMIKNYRMLQTSSGEASQQTLRPNIFTEEVSENGGKETRRTEFDWANSTVRFSQGGEAKLTPQAQDILSILYQFPPMQQQTVSIHIGTGKKFEEYRFEVVLAEKLETAMGALQTVHFRKLHAPDKEGFEIWFAQEYRFLPVKVRHLDRDGKISAEAIITDIRVSDE